MYQSCSNASSWYGVAEAWMNGVIPTSKSSASHPLPVVGLPTIAITGSSRRKEGEECSQKRKERWRDSETERGMKAESVVALSCLPLDCPVDLRTFPSLTVSFSSRSLSLGKHLLRNFFMNSRACWQYWGCLKTHQFNSCVYGLGPG